MFPGSERVPLSCFVLRSAPVLCQAEGQSAEPSSHVASAFGTCSSPAPVAEKSVTICVCLCVCVCVSVSLHQHELERGENSGGTLQNIYLEISLI